MAKKNKNKNKPDGTEEDSLVVGPFDPSTLTPSTTGGYDPNNSYGLLPSNPDIGTFDEWLANQGLNKNKLKGQRKQRLKDQWLQASGPTNQEYALTPEGEQWTNENRDKHWNYLMAEAGALAPSMEGSQFAQYLATEAKARHMAGYDAALEASHGNLGFADYMSTIGYAPGQQVNTLMGSPPRDTGNPFTSTSMPQAGAGTGVQINQSYNNARQMAAGQGQNWNQMGKNQRQRARNAFTGQPENSTLQVGNITVGGPQPSAPTLPNPDGLAEDRKRYLSLLPQQRGINTGTSFRPGRWAVYG